MEFSEIENLNLSLNDQLNTYFKHDAASRTGNATFGCIMTLQKLKALSIEIINNNFPLPDR